MSRSDLFRDLIQRWANSKRPRRCSPEKIEKMEAAFSIVLPSSYREFLGSYGGPWLPRLGDFALSDEPEIPCVQQMHRPGEVVKVTKLYVSGGMPAGFVCIGSDCMGNVYCLKISECQSEHQDEAPVWFFDHDYDTITVVASTFEQWIRAHLEVAG